MPAWVILLRGINVGGKHRLSMADLKSYLLAIGVKQVETYIQSGNAIVETDAKLAKALPQLLAEQIELHHGFRPMVLAISQSKFRKAISNNPFAQATENPKSLHFFFLTAPSKTIRQEMLNELCSTTEQYLFADDVFYLYAPDGIGRSKLAEKVDKILGVPTTARNLKTVTQLDLMLTDT